MNRLGPARQAQVVRCLCEGNSIRSTVRMTGVAKNTVAKLLVEVGAACATYQDHVLRGLTCKRIQADEIWSFVFAKQKNVTLERARKQVAGDVWTWTAIDADTKLVCSWMIGQRDAVAARTFMEDLEGRLTNRVQLTTYGPKAYLTAVDKALGGDIDYAMLVKIFGEPSEEPNRYSPADCIGCKKETIKGQLDPEHITTSFAERQNLTIRLSMRRFTRVTNGFSKKIENHSAALALYFMWYNFGRKHMTLGMTPAMAAGLEKRAWTVEEIVSLSDSN